MGTAKMSRTSDQAEKSDDLIAELARIMAEDAQGEGPAAAPANDRNGLRPAPTRPASDALGNPATSNASTAPSDRLAAAQGGAALFDKEEQSAYQQTADVAMPPVGAADVLSPLPNSPAPAAGSLRPEQGDVLGELSGELSPEDRHYENDAFGESENFGLDEASLESATSDPIADLIAAQLEQAAPATRPSPPVAPQPTEAPSLYEETDRFAGEEFFPAADDNFSVSPAFGLKTAGNPDPASSSAANDPLLEIEKLIGEAVNAGVPGAASDPLGGLSADPLAEEPVRRSYTPPPLQTESRNDVDGAARAADAAMLAAAAAITNRAPEVRTPAAAPATNDELHDALMSQEPEPTVQHYQEDLSKPPFWQRLIGPLVAASLLVAIGLGLFWIFGTEPITSEEAPVLAADSTPVKAAPEPVVEKETSTASNSVVFNELAGETAPGNTEQLVSRDQAGSDVSRVITDETSNATRLANRKVRTVTVRPDGTIVTADDTLAGSEILPVDRPDVPTLPATAANVASQFSNTPIITETPTTTATALAAPVVDAVRTVETRVQDTIQPVVASGEALTAPIPRPRPIVRRSAATPVVTNSINSAASTSNGQAVDLIADIANSAVATAAPAQQLSSVPVVTAGAGPLAPAYVQLSSQRSAEAAESSRQEILSRYSSALAGQNLEIQRVDLGDQGIYFRVRMPASSIETAHSVCSNVKDGGGDCFVRTN